MRATKKMSALLTKRNGRGWDHVSRGYHWPGSEIVRFSDMIGLHNPELLILPTTAKRKCCNCDTNLQLAYRDRTLCTSTIAIFVPQSQRGHVGRRA